MAGNKMSSKTKSKEVVKSKTNQQDDDNEDEVDFSLLRKPIMTNTTGFARAKKIYDLATEELKELMAKECDLLYECKVCRNIFRSLPNFISHKRVYCKGKFNERSHGHFMAAAALSTELQKIQSLEKSYQESLSNADAANSDDDRIPITKDLTTVIEKLTKTRGVREGTDDHTVKLEKIPSSSAAVFQNVNLDEDEGSNNSMRAQVLELDRILSQDQAVLKEDGSFAVESSTDSQDVIHISDDDDDQAKLKCKICKTQFSTAKTLRFHMKYKHESSRLVFPCPDCADTFSNSWSVYRHLFKVHRKSAAQIRRLRESIQAKAFKMNNPPASYEKRKVTAKPVAKLTEEERLDQENQAWMESMEGLGARPRCGGCGRAFERRAALRQHTAGCGARGRALAASAASAAATAATAAGGKREHKIGIQIRKDYNKEKVQKAPPQPLIKNDTGTTNKLGQDENAQCSFNKTEENKPLEEAKMFIDNEEQNSDSNKESTSPTESPEKTDDLPVIPKELADKPKIKLLFTMQAEKLSHNLKALKQAISTRSDADIDSYTCKKCDRKCKNMVELCDHMAGHYKWMRYSCKLCNYKNYYFEKVTEHVKIVHKLKGDTDFYYSTVKCIGGTEALELMEVEDENESPERRPSRCSSDSSRLSDDSSNSSAKPDNAKKRKIGIGRGNWKRKKDPVDKDEADNTKGNPLTMDNVINVIFAQKNQRKAEEDEDIEISRKQVDITSAPYRRPVRNRAKRKNEDFEYDLSNLLKMEAQGYRDSSTTKVVPTVMATKATVNRKKSLPDSQSPLANEVLSRNFSGALLAMAKRSVEVYAAHIKPFDMSVFNPQPSAMRELKTFARPLIPKFASRAEKISPKTTPVKENKLDECTELEILNVGAKPMKEVVVKTESPEKVQTQNPAENGDTKEEFIPAVVPVNFKRESMELIKNPIVNKSLSDFSKAGMKTKILVIKPLNKPENSLQRLKFQRIKLKDPTKTGSDDANSDQVMLVKVPPVVVPKATNESTETKNTEEEEVSECNGTHEESVSGETNENPETVENNEDTEMVVDSDPLDVNNSSEMEVDATA